MLPASDLTEILTNLAALNLQPNTTAQILAAVLAPLLRSSNPDPPEDLSRRARGGQAQPKPCQAGPQKRKYQRGAPDARDRARAALRANPDTSLTVAKVSRSTVVNVRKESAAKERHKPRETSKPATPKTDRRERPPRPTSSR